MTPAELRAHRRGLNLTQKEFGEAMGYTGDRAGQMISDFEGGRRAITRRIEMAVLYLQLKLKCSICKRNFSTPPCRDMLRHPDWDNLCVNCGDYNRKLNDYHHAQS